MFIESLGRIGVYACEFWVLFRDFRQEVGTV